jgi:hypothetical protein
MCDSWLFLRLTSDLASVDSAVKHIKPIFERRDHVVYQYLLQFCREFFDFSAKGIRHFRF